MHRRAWASPHDVLRLSALRRLSEALWHGPPEEARAAAAELARHPDPRAVPPLLGALDRPWCTEAAADALVALGADAVPALMAALPRKVGFHAAGVLARLGPVAAPHVVAGASSPNGQVRSACVRLLPAVAPERAEGLLWQAWTDRDCGVRVAAGDALSRLGITFSREQLLVAARRCPHRHDHVNVWSLALHARDPDVHAFLRELAPLPYRGEAAVQILASKGDVDFVLGILNSDDPVAVGQVARMVSYHGPPELHPVVLARVLDRSGSTPEVRAAAAAGLGRVMARRHAAHLVAIVADDDEDPGVRAACLTQLPGALAEEELTALCARVSESDDRRLRHTAVNAMPPGPRLAELLQQAAADPDWNIRNAADWRRRDLPSL